MNKSDHALMMIKIHEEAKNNQAKTLCPCGNGTISVAHVDEQSYEQGWKDAAKWLFERYLYVEFDSSAVETESQKALTEKIKELRKAAEIRLEVDLGMRKE